MDTGHLDVKTHKRSLGHSVAAAFAYRGGLALQNPNTGEVYDYKKRSHFGDVAASGIVAARPSALAQSHQTLADAMERREGRWNSWICRDVEISHPEGMDREAFEEETKKFAMKLAMRYDTIASWFLHRPGVGDTRGWHSHIILSTRTLSDDGKTLDQKITVLDNPRSSGREVAWMRNEWGTECSAALRRRGQVDATVRMGRRLDAAPDVTLGQDVTAMERKSAIAAGFDIQGMSIRELLSTVDPITERGKDARDIILSRDDSDPQYATYSRSNLDRWIEKKVRDRDPELAEALDEWSGEIPSVIDAMKIAKQREEEQDEKTFQVEPETTRQSDGRMSLEERRARRQKEGRGKGRQRGQRGHSEVVATAPVGEPEQEPVVPEHGESEAEAARLAPALDEALPDGETRDVIDAQLAADAAPHEQSNGVAEPEQPPDADTKFETRRLDGILVAEALATDEDAELPYRALAWDRDEAMDTWARAIDSGEIEIVQELTVESTYAADDHDTFTEPPPRPPFGPHYSDRAAEIVDGGDGALGIEQQMAFDPEEHQDTTAARIDAGELGPTFGPAPPLPRITDIDLDRIEDVALPIIDNKLLRLDASLDASIVAGTIDAIDDNICFFLRGIRKRTDADARLEQPPLGTVLPAATEETTQDDDTSIAEGMLAAAQRAYDGKPDTEEDRAIVKSGVRRVGHAAALLSSMSSMPSLNWTPSMTFASWRNPRSRRQDFSAHLPIL